MFPPIVIKKVIRAPVEITFYHIAHPDGLNSWFTTECKIDTAPGGDVFFRWANFGPDAQIIEDGGKLLALEYPTRFAFTWRPGVSETAVELSLQQSADGTLVSLKEEGYTNDPSDVRAMLDCACGWGEALTELKYHLLRRQDDEKMIDIARASFNVINGGATEVLKDR